MISYCNIYKYLAKCHSVICPIWEIWTVEGTLSLEDKAKKHPWIHSIFYTEWKILVIAVSSELTKYIW